MYEDTIERNDEQEFDHLNKNVSADIDEINLGIIDPLNIANWYDYNYVIKDRYDYILNYYRKKNLSRPNHNYVLVQTNVYLIYELMKERRKYNRFYDRDHTWLRDKLKTLLKVMLLEFMKYKYLFFGEEFLKKGFVKSKRPLASCCSAIHGKQIIIGYLTYKHCYDIVKIQMR